jgi:hypothetical protein
VHYPPRDIDVLPFHSRRVAYRMPTVSAISWDGTREFFSILDLVRAALEAFADEYYRRVRLLQ